MGWLCTQGMSEHGSAESTEVSSFLSVGIEQGCILHHSPNYKASGDTCRLNQELLEFFAVIRVEDRDGGLCAMISGGREKRRPCEKNTLCHVSQTPVTISRLYALAFLHSEKPTSHTNRNTTEMVTLNAGLHEFTLWQEYSLP